MSTYKKYRLLGQAGGYILCFALLLAACSSGPTSVMPSTPQPSRPGQIAQVPSLPTVPEICQPTPFTSAISGALPEAQGTATNATLWSLFFANPQAIHSGHEIKIVWRMTGDGGFHIVARHSGNIEVKPVWGPEEHEGSSWQRPGLEWGTGFNFPEPGCWDLHATRSNAVGDLWIMVQK